jgi:hypothetical protein
MYEISHQKLDWVRLRPGLTQTCGASAEVPSLIFLDNVDEIENHDEIVTPSKPSIFQNLEVVGTSN